MSRFSPTLGGRVSRREIALSPLVWGAVSASFAIFFVVCLGVAFVVPTDHPALLAGFAIALGVVAIVLVRLPPPEPDAVTTHVVIVLAYVGTSAAMVFMAPHTVAALPVAIFVGSLSAIWLEDRRQIAAHYVAATVILLLPSTIGPGDTATLVATLTLLPGAWALGSISLWVLETAERQSDRLELLAMRDALTGVGNRRLLDERLEIELQRHRALRRPLTVLALDLNGFKAVNDTLGHAAGDRLLVYVAARLTEVTGERATVIRQGGDEFCVLLPDTGPARAARVIDRIRRALGPVVETGIGLATFPVDDGSPTDLIELADARLTAEKAQRRGGPIEPHPWLRDGALPETPVASCGDAAASESGHEASRRAIGASPVVWRLTGTMFLFYTVAGVALRLLAPELTGAGLPWILTITGLVGVAIIGSSPPQLHTWRSDTVVALSYLAPAALLVDSGALPSLAIGASVFAGPLIAIRTSSRRRAGIHIAIATACFLGGSLLTGPSLSAVLAMLMLTATMNVLAICCVVILEGSEAQGVELARLAVTDPLTGLANRRRVTAAAEEAIAAGAGSVTAIALDLNGFKALNDAAGHGAGDELLIAVADGLRATVPAGATIARPGGDEFTVIISDLTTIDLAVLIDDLRTAVARLSRPAHPISTGVGVASYPADADDARELIKAADHRLLIDKYGTTGAQSDTRSA